jgi:predicted negative regulator of RcsB-dependent stress response
VEELSEQEQWEQLKGWVRGNGPQVLILVALMLLGWFGWKWWQGREQQQDMAASATYQDILARLDANKVPEATALLETLRSEDPKSPYVFAADLVLARAYVENNQLDKAADVLQGVMNTAPDNELRPIARVRLARVQAAQGKYDEALTTLGTASLGAFESARLEERGDILLAKGDRAGALAEYQAARKLEPSSDEQASSVGSAADLLDLKISDLKNLPASQPATPTPTPAPSPAPADSSKPAARP